MYSWVNFWKHSIIAKILSSVAWLILQQSSNTFLTLPCDKPRLFGLSEPPFYVQLLRCTIDTMYSWDLPSQLLSLSDMQSAEPWLTLCLCSHQSGALIFFLLSPRAHRWFAFACVWWFSPYTLPVQKFSAPRATRRPLSLNVGTFILYITGRWDRKKSPISAPMPPTPNYKLLQPRLSTKHNFQRTFFF
jgi:hypothetical protein